MMDLKLTQAEYERFREFILESTGLDFSDDKRHMLNRGLAEVMNQIGCADSDQLYRMLHSRTSGTSLWDRVVGALTVGETYFFRNTSHWDALRQHIIPGLMAQREHSRRLRIWSAGCATGEEPYSIAILLREMIPNLDRWNILILATDINREALRKAQDGAYGAWSFRGVERHIQDAYFRLDGRQYVIDDTIKRMVTFCYLNLVGDPYPSLVNNTHAMDIILCRNVTIYFTPQVTTDVVKHFYDSLTGGGWLIPGPSEPNMVYYGDFDTRNFPGTVVYQKAKAPKSQPCPGSSSCVPAFVPQTKVLRAEPIVSIRPIEPTQPIGPSVAPRPDPFEVALQLLSEGKPDEAVVKLHEKLEQAADFVPAYYTLGKVYANQGNLVEAQAWCERAIHKDRLHAEPYFTLSLIYQEHGLLDQAIGALKRAIYLDRGFILAHYNLAQMYQRQSDQLNARRSLHNAIRLLDDQPRDVLVPEGDGLTVGRLRELIELELNAQQNPWPERATF